MVPRTKSSQEIVKPDFYEQQQLGSARNKRGEPQLGDYYNRPLMSDKSSQTDNDFKILCENIIREEQYQREKMLEKQIKELKENIRDHARLISQIKATSARSAELLGQARNQTNTNNGFSNQYKTNLISNNELNNNNLLNKCVSVGITHLSISSITSNRSIQLSPKIVYSINSTKQVSSPSPESVKYRSFAENAVHNNEEPIKIQLAEEDEALNLNNSVHSKRLKIYLGIEQNDEIAKNNTERNAMQPYEAPNYSAPSISREYHQYFIKEHNLCTTRNTNENEESIELSQQSTNEIHPFISNSFLQMLIMQNRNNNVGSHIPITSIQLLNGTGDEDIVSSDLENFKISIGPNNTRIPAKIYENINWSSAPKATRKLLLTVFERKVLATHSPDFKDHEKPAGKILDPLKTADIIYVVTRKCNVTDQEVRDVITAKCADANKVMKRHLKKRRATN